MPKNDPEGYLPNVKKARKKKGKKKEKAPKPLPKMPKK